MATPQIVSELRRDLHQLQGTVVNATALAPIRLQALVVRLKRLCEAVIYRSRLAGAHSGQLVIVRRLALDSHELASHTLACSVIVLFLEREAIAHRIRILQAQISNLGLRLGIVLPPHRSINDIQQSAADATSFNALLHRYSSATTVLHNLIRTTPPTTLMDFHRRLEAEIRRGTLRGLSMQEYRFAVVVNRVIEMHLRAARQPVPLLRHAQTIRHTSMPPLAQIRAQLGQAPTVPAHLPPRSVRSPYLPAFPGRSPPSLAAIFPALPPLGNGRYGRGLSMSTPIRPLNTPRLPQSARMDDRRVQFDLSHTGTPGPDPLLFEDGPPFASTSTSTAYVPLFPSASTQAPDVALGEPEPFLRTSRVSFSASPQNVALQSPTSPLLDNNRDIIIRYYDSSLGRLVDWRPFQGWLWPSPSTLDHVVDYNRHPIRPGSIIILISSFSTLDEVLSLAVLDRITTPSRAPPLLSSRSIGIGARLQVLQIFKVRNTAWLACLPLSTPSSGSNGVQQDAKPGFVPLKAVITQGTDPPESVPGSVPRRFVVPLHGSARAFDAVFRFADTEGRIKTASVRGVVHERGISYYEARNGEAGGRQFRWFGFPYSRIVSLSRGTAGTGQILLVIREANRDRPVQIHLRSVTEAEYLLRDVDRMRRLHAPSSRDGEETSPFLDSS